MGLFNNQFAVWWVKRVTTCQFHVIQHYFEHFCYFIPRKEYFFFFFLMLYHTRSQLSLFSEFFLPFSFLFVFIYLIRITLKIFLHLWFSNFNVKESHESSKYIVKFAELAVWGGAWDSAFLTSVQWATWPIPRQPRQCWGSIPGHLTEVVLGALFLISQWL